MNEVIIGGWEYVIAAYIVTWVGLLGYGAYLFTREKSEVPVEVGRSGDHE